MFDNRNLNAKFPIYFTFIKVLKLKKISYTSNSFNWEYQMFLKSSLYIQYQSYSTKFSTLDSQALILSTGFFLPF